MPQPPHPPPPKHSKDDPTYAASAVPSVSGSGQVPASPAVASDYSSQPTVNAASLSGSNPGLERLNTPMPFSSEGSFPYPNPTGKVDPNIGQVFGGKYQIDRILGEGGMGIVYLARHKAIGKKFAIKLLHQDATKDPEVVERFKVEAQAASSIGNEHIVDITDFAELPDGQTYFVMELLEGKALSTLFSELKRVPTQRLVKIARQLSQGLGAAHAAGIVHRDLKPDNIYLCKRSGGETDFVKILDFGIAKVGQGASKLTKAGAIFGTPHYMSPEQASGSPVDHRTDIYALGVMLYEGAVGRVPFDADNFMGILTQHMYKAPVPPRAVPECPSDLSPGLEVIIMRCLRKKTEERYQTMEELEQDLDRLARGEVPKAAQDMMALSAGYQSLAQSAITAAGMPRPIPGEPPGGMPKKKAWPLYAGIAGVVAAIGITAAVLIGPGKGSAGSPKNDNKAEPTEQPTPKETASAKPSTTASATEAPKKMRLVLLTVGGGVSGAKFYDGDKFVGDEPFNYELEDGATKKLTVKAEGYIDKEIILDKKTPAKLSASMTHVPIKSVPTIKKPGGSEADDPWGKK
jgi:serine/threonine protein kinase